MMDDVKLADLHDLDDLEFIARQVVEGYLVGLHKSPFHGFSVEFAEHRLYNVGESTRHIDWKLFARTDRLFIKRYEEETNIRVNIILDVSSSMYFPDNVVNKARFSVFASAALFNLFKSQRDAFGFYAIGNEILKEVSPGLSDQHYSRCLKEIHSYLSPPNVAISTHLTTKLHEIAEKINRRSLVIIFSDFFTENIDDMKDLLSAFQHLKYNKHEIIVIHTGSSLKEHDFNYENMPYVFVDLETNQEIKLNPQQVKSKVTANYNSFLQSLRSLCGSAGIELIEADIEKGFSQIFAPYLWKRSKLL
jgi:uncharacterized protein (DUF58 family)